MTKLLSFQESARHKVHGFFEDFEWFTTAHRFTNTSSNSGGVKIQDAKAGIVFIDPSDLASEGDNDEEYLHTTQEQFVLTDDKAILFRARVLPKADTIATGLNMFVGLMDAVAADCVQDDGAGPKASGTHIGFSKVDGKTCWDAHSSISTSQTTVNTAITATNNTWTELRAEIIPKTSTIFEVHFFIDDVECGWDVTTSPGNRIAHTITLGTAVEMDFVIGVKAGAANAAINCKADYVEVWQER